MPIYDVKCDKCGFVDVDVYAKMDGTHVCSVCNGPASRIPVLPSTDLKEFHTPIQMYSVACNTMEEVRAMQAAGVPISDDPSDEMFGVPIAATRKQKLAALKVAGHIETK